MPSTSPTRPRRLVRGTARRVASQGGGLSRAHYPGYDHQPGLQPALVSHRL
jgi:hypothetical protein